MQHGNTQPHLRSISRKAYAAALLMKKIEEPALCQIDEFARANLPDECIEGTVAIGQESNQLTVRRNLSVDFAAFVVGKTRKRRARQRVGPWLSWPGEPGGDSPQYQDRYRRNRHKPPTSCSYAIRHVIAGWGCG